MNAEISRATSMGVARHLPLPTKSQPFVVYPGNCHEVIKGLKSESVQLIMSSPPYFMGKDYDRSTNLEDFKVEHKALIPEMVRVLKPGGSLCWQVGSYKKHGILYPLDLVILQILEHLDIHSQLHLRNRIVWTYGHGLHSTKVFSGRYETMLWFTKGSNYYFDLDAVRVPQKYPGKKATKGKKKGQYSGNPLGKNPGDVWDIPNVKANHIEKTSHPCQFPVGLVQRCVRSMTKKGDIVLDPFSGVASSGVGAIVEGRRYIGIEISSEYNEIANQRLKQAHIGKARYRDIDAPVYVPTGSSSVEKIPETFTALKKQIERVR